MTSLRISRNSATYSTILLFLQTVYAARVPYNPSPTAALDLHTVPVITAAPSPDQVNKRLVARSVLINSCATSCIASAVTKSTECKLGDYACECQPLNESAIYYGAFNCIEAACGAIEAEAVLSEGQALCSSFAAYGGGSSTTLGSSGAQTTGSSGSGGSGGSGGSSGSGNSGSGNSGSGNSSGSGGSSSQSSSGLSSGAIAGVALGAAAIAVIAAGLLYYFCVQRKRQNKNITANIVSQNSATNNAPPMVAAAPIPDSNGKPMAQMTTSTTPVSAGGYPPSAPSTSPYPSTMNTVSPISHGSPPVYPGTTELPGGWQQQQPNFNQAHNPQTTYAPMPQSVPQGYHEVHGQTIPPGQPHEMFVNPQMRNELHGQPVGSGVYEMPSKPGS